MRKIIFAAVLLTSCGDTTITNNNENHLSAEMSASCGEPSCQFEQARCPDCFNAEFREGIELSFESCLETLGCK